MAELQPIVVFHGRHFFRHLGICNPICVKLIGYVRCHSAQFKKKPRLYLKPFSCFHKRGIHTDRHTHTRTHDDSIRWNAMRCISPKNAPKFKHFQQQKYIFFNVKFNFIDFRDSTSNFRLWHLILDYIIENLKAFN